MLDLLVTKDFGSVVPWRMIIYNGLQENLFYPVGKTENERNYCQVCLLLLWAIFTTNFPGPVSTMTT